MADRAGEICVEKRQRVARVAVGEGCVGCAFAAQHASQPAAAFKPLDGLFAARPTREGQPRLRLGDPGIQRGRAVQEVVHGREVCVDSIGQIATRDQPLPGPPNCMDTIFDRLEPAAAASEQEARLSGA
jgi:hypothetical protein